MITKKPVVLPLRTVLGLVVLWQSIRFALSSPAAHQAGKSGLPFWLPPVLGGVEALAAVLFLIPALTIVGGYALIAIFAVAILIHALHGDFEFGALLVYAMAAMVCIADRQRQAERSGER
jgi:uncharacterized Tic20 family protein